LHWHTSYFIWYTRHFKRGSEHFVFTTHRTTRRSLVTVRQNFAPQLSYSVCVARCVSARASCRGLDKQCLKPSVWDRMPCARCLNVVVMRNGRTHHYFVSFGDYFKRFSDCSVFVFYCFRLLGEASVPIDDSSDPFVDSSVPTGGSEALIDDFSDPIDVCRSPIERRLILR
jgi:hypothetical protein